MSGRRDPESDLRCHVRTRREEVGLSQKALAERVGVSRQAILAIEAERHFPATPLALRLARALGCRVEDLFTFSNEPRVAAELPEALPEGTRVSVGRVRERWVAHPVGGAATTADGVVEASGVKALVELAPLENRILVAGCAPLLGLLAELGSTRGKGATRWLPRSSHAALELLERGFVHAAGVHLSAPDDDLHLELVRERFPGEDMIVVNLTCWWQGLVLPRGNPAGIVDLADVAKRPGFRFAHRGPGSGARALLERELGGTEASALPGPLARGHEDVAWLVSAGAVDAGIAAEGAVRPVGLDFLPLAEERFDLIVRAGDVPRVPLSRLFDDLAGGRFRAQVRHLPGYSSKRTGERVEVRA